MIRTLFLMVLLSGCAHHVSKQNENAVYRGLLRTGIMAIGGETTGTTLTTAHGEVIELDFDDRKLPGLYRGKQVEVVGKRVVLKSPERGERQLLQVSEVKLLP